MVTPANNPPDTKPTQQLPVIAKPEQAPDTPSTTTVAPAPASAPAKPSPAPSPAPTKTPDPTPAAEPVVPAVVELSRDQRIMQELEHRYLQIKELGDASYFSHEAICRKCGWHTLENSLEAATSLMSGHVVRHWKDVAALIK